MDDHGLSSARFFVKSFSRRNFFCIAFAFLGLAGIAGAKTIAAGQDHVCEVTAGRARCWGGNDQGQLGTGDRYARRAPTSVSGLQDLQAIAAGFEHTCALDAAGAVWCWGNNASGQSGLGGGARSVAEPQRVIASDRFVELAAGGHRTCARSAAGEVWCWGSNIYGSLGTGDTVDRPTPTRVRGLSGVTSIAVADYHACAIAGSDAQRRTFCWGSNEHGALGTGNRTGSTTPAEVPGSESFVRIFAGGWHTCGIREPGSSAACWGNNSSGQLGVGDTINRLAPAPMTSAMPDGVSVIAPGWVQTCLTSGDRTYCTGSNEYGQLGTFTASGAASLRAGAGPVPGLDGIHVKDLAAGSMFICAQTEVDVRCWGDGREGTLGNGNDPNSTIPRYIPGTEAAVALDSADQHSCFIDTPGTLRCWGANRYMQLGFSDRRDRPQPVSSTNLKIESVATGWLFTCALSETRDVLCWGSNATGQLGTGDFLDRALPVRAVLNSPSDALAVGGWHACAVAGGHVYCWGANRNGQLGTGRSGSTVAVPARVPDLADVKQIAAGYYHTCALRTDGRVFCWGSNKEGQLGRSDIESLNAPDLDAPVLDDVVSLSTNRDTTCALRNDRSVHCWGDNTAGQLGVGNFLDGKLPQQVAALPPATAVDVGAYHACAALQDGRAACWGAGSDGQLGDGNRDISPVPRFVHGLTSVRGIAAGSSHTCFLGTSGTGVACTGRGQKGQLGNGFMGYSLDPGAVVGESPWLQSGWYWNPFESGRGFVFERRGDRLALAGFHYEADGRATWFMSSGSLAAHMTSPMLVLSGGQTLGGSYRPATAAPSLGTVRLTPTAPTQAVLGWTGGGSVALERFGGDRNSTPSGPLSAGVEPGLWWNPEESGRGFAIEFQGDRMFLVGFMFDDAGRPTWYLSTETMAGPGWYRGRWGRFANGQPIGGSYRPPVLLEDAGAVEVRFADARNGELTLPDGRRIKLTRFEF